MGKRGPIPARGLSRRKSRQDAIDARTTVGQVEVNVEAPYEPDDTWHPIALSTYDAVQRSGQAEFYAESDWAKLYLACEQLSRELKPQFVGFADDWKVIKVDGEERLVPYKRPISGVVPMKGASVNAIQALFASLGISEGDRRRMGIDLVRTKPQALDEAAEQARNDAALMEAMRTGNVVDIHRASGE